MQDNKRRGLRYDRITALILAAAMIVALPLMISVHPPDNEEKDLSESEKSSDSAVPDLTAEISNPESETAELDIIGEVTPNIESLGDFSLTAYCPCVKCCGVWSEEHPSRIGTDYIQKTASGTIPEAGRTVGVDPDVIPFGTVVIINGHEYIAEDRGGAVKGNSIDIFFDDHNEALEFGRQTAEVFIKN